MMKRIKWIRFKRKYKKNNKKPTRKDDENDLAKIMNKKPEKRVFAHLQNKRQLITLTRTLFLFLFRTTLNQCEFNKSNRVYVLAEILICWSVYLNELTIFMNVRIRFHNAAMIRYSIYCYYESGISLICWICTKETLVTFHFIQQ